MFYRVLLRVLAASGAAALFLIPAATAFGGNANAGDVWVDTYGQQPGPGHEMDPHLPCQNISLWGAKLADPSGSYSIDGWAPSGSQDQDYSGTWTVNGSQPLDVINVKTLIAQAVANGDTPQNNQGYHFKLQFTQDPQKHKTFWVDCPAPSTNPPPTNPPPTNPPPTNPPPTNPPATNPPSTPPVTVTTTSNGSKQSIGAANVLRCRRGMVKGTKRVHGKKVVACIARKKRHVKHLRVVIHRRDPVFTG